ncbi:hypothetical protein LQR31_05975 [Chromobacterium vaccinii]|uniref:hypothetical protein n=1 Tax=Chromobacterium vaccinii TaxID=1108595 RepID=UPI001E55B021|nr:hypothetical protein [Chromobacterium vaccinii]MCD4484023.1 hypothetical protein [Chromobacterium vaccinii]
MKPYRVGMPSSLELKSKWQRERWQDQLLDMNLIQNGYHDDINGIKMQPES